MFNVNGIRATLIQHNRNDSSVYDDQDMKTIPIKVCPYNVDQAIRFGIYTIPEATGYFICKSKVDVREGDQVLLHGRKFTVLEVKDNWIWNKVANIGLFVK